MDFTDEAKRKLQAMGEKEFECKNEYRVPIGKRFSYIDYVWLKQIPHPDIEDKKVVVAAFEITKNLTSVWDMKKMKGDIVNLQLSNASLGVLIIPCLEDLRKQAQSVGGESWLIGIKDYFQALVDIARPMKIEVWVFYNDKGKFEKFL